MMDLFVFKKLLGALLMPLPICFILIALSLVAIIQHRKWLAWIFSSASILLFLMISTPFIPDFLLAQTESKFPQFDVSQKIHKIVILGCGHVEDPKLPITSQLYTCSTVRLNEALRIYQFNKNSLFITSGALPQNKVSNAEMNKRFLLAMGVEAQNIISIEKSRDTEEEAQNIKAHLLGETFAVVTSASHMQRAMKLFQDQGLEPIAAPTEHLVRHAQSRPWQYMLPNSKNISKMERWWYETLGSLWLRLKAHIT
jgi:uncharacterized SAM-binding protein YcdF (DUF218 family)